MRASVISFTDHGAMLAKRLLLGFQEEGIQTEAWIKKKKADPPEGVRILTEPLREWTKEQFAQKEVLVFIGAAGIAVRSIAPYVRSKKEDPAVIVVDEQGRHAISLLSGHIGGANRLTLLTAEILGASPVITTATDLNGKFAVDSFAAVRDMHLDSMEYAKEIAADLVAGKAVGLYSSFPLWGTVPEELLLADGGGQNPPELGISIGVQKDRPFDRTLHLVPRVLVLGIGCRRGTEAEQIREAVFGTLAEYGIFPESICRIASIDLKKDEAGLQEFTQSLGIPFVTFPAEELQQVELPGGLSESEFVRTVTGVGNVCERSALLGSGAKELLIPKTIRNKVTVAAALAEYTVCMED